MADASTNPSVKIWGVDELSAFERIMQCYTNKIECCIPAQILDYDRQSHIATVRPLTNIVYESGNAQVRAKLRVTVLRMCSGGYIIDLPIKKGDTGWIIAADNDSSLVKQANASVNPEKNKGTQNPNVFSHHKFSHGFFVCDNWAKISDEKFRDKLVIGDIDEDGTDTYFTIDKEGHFNIFAENEACIKSKVIKLDGDTEVLETLTVDKDLIAKANARIYGNLDVDGKTMLNGDVHIKQNLQVDGTSNRINDCTEQELEVVKVEESKTNTTLNIYKTKVFHNGLEFVKKVVVKGGGGGGGGGKSIDTVIIAPFTASRVTAGNSEVMFFLPDETAYVGNKQVDFSTNFNTVSGSWKKSNEADNTDTVWCYFCETSDGNYVAHMANERVSIGTYDEDDGLVIACFAVCSLTGVSDMSVFSGITQLSYGSLFLNIIQDYPFKVKYDSENQEFIVYLPENSIIHSIDGQLTSIDNLEIDDTQMEEASSGETDWYKIKDSSASTTGDISCILEAEYISGTETASWEKFYVKSGALQSTDKGFKIASIKNTAIIKQFVFGSLLFNTTITEGGETVLYYADEHSVSKKNDAGTDTNVFQLMGFGKFNDSIIGESGNFVSSSELELEVGNEAKPEIAFLVRTGNVNMPNANNLGYRTLKLKSHKTPFMYTIATGIDPETSQTVTTRKLTNCKFYWEGELQELQDFDCSGIIANGTAYLCGKQVAPTAETPTPAWTWTIETQVQEAPDGGKVLNYKLYDFAQGKPNIDYRDTFLSLEDTTQKAKLTVAKPSADTGSIVLDTTGAKPKLVITDSDGHKISLDLANGCGNDFQLRPMTYYNSAGVQQTVHILACGNVNIPAASQGTDVTISAGTGIKVNSSTGEGSKSFTISNKGVLSVNGQSTDSNAVNGTLTIMGVNGSGLKTRTVQQTPPTEEAPLSNGTIYFDIEGRDALPEGCAKNFAARKLAFTHKTQGDLEYHFFGCSDIDLRNIKGSQEQADWNESDSTKLSFIKNKPNLNVDVVTGISMSVNTSGSTSKLVATITKRNLQTGNVTTTNQDILTLTNASVVASSEYTADTFKFVNTMVNLLVLGTSTPSPSTSEVFSTTPHSQQ